MTAPSFGKRGLIGAPAKAAPTAPSPRRLRSGAVAVGAVGALALGIAASAEMSERACGPRPTAFDPNSKTCALICKPSAETGKVAESCDDLCKTHAAPAANDPNWCHTSGSHSHSSGHYWGSSSSHSSGGGFFGLGHASFGGFGAHGFGHGGG